MAWRMCFRHRQIHGRNASKLEAPTLEKKKINLETHFDLYVRYSTISLLIFVISILKHSLCHVDSSLVKS